MRALYPKEHGAYAQLGFPLITGMAYSGGRPGALAFAVAAVAVFLAHEPLALLAGTRGARLRDQLGEGARRRLLFLIGVALAGGTAAALLAPARAWWGALLPAGLGLLLLPTMGRKSMKSIPAEATAAAAFASIVLPLALCGDAPPYEAGLAAAAWFAAFLPAILAVHAIKAALRRRPEERWILRAAPVVAAAAVVAATAGGLLVPDGRELLAAVPPATAALVLSLRPPHPRHLERVGWTMVAANTLALILLLAL